MKAKLRCSLELHINRICICAAPAHIQCCLGPARKLSRKGVKMSCVGSVLVFYLMLRQLKQMDSLDS